MKFLSDILAKAGLTVDGVVTLNNTATGQTPAANDNSTKLATTAWVRGFVTPYTLPIASGTTLGGIKIGSGLSIDGTGIVSVAASGVGAIRALQQITATAGQTVFTVSGGYTPGLIDVFLNGVLLTPTAIDASNGNTFTLTDAAAAGDLLDIFVYNPIYNGFISSTDQVPEGTINLYYTNARARAAITLTVTGTSGASTYNSGTGVLNIPTYTLAGLGGVPTGRTITIDGVAYDLSADRIWNILPTGGAAGDILAKNSATNYDVAWIPNYTSSVKHTVKAAVALTKGQAVYVSSADGTNMIVSKASNAAESTSSKTLGLVAQDLAINGQGFVVTEGLLAGLDTSTATAGDPVWLGTNGNLIFGLVNKPTAPAHLVFIGIVTRVQSNNGEIFVKVQNGFELDELHNLSVASPSDGDMIKYVASTGLWTKIAATTTNITEGTNLYYTDARARAAISVTGSGSYDSATGVITVTGGVTSVNTLTGAVTLTTSNIAEGTNLYYTDARVNTYLTANNYATQSYVGAAIANLVDSAPTTLDTLNELAAALGDDPDFATTVSTSIGTKVPQSRTITINGTAYDLSADRAWTIASGVTSFNTRTGDIVPATGDYTTAQVTESGNLYFTNTRARSAISLTTTGTSGAATYDNTTGVLNIPQYQGGVTSFNTRTGAITLTSTDVTDALGFTPASSVSSSSRTIQTYIATANQTTFTVTGGYVVGLVDVYINGIKISTSDFTATNGSTVVLTTGTGSGNIVEVVRYNTAFTATNALRQITYFTATAGQTTFTVTYNPGLVDVFYNGSKLAASDYTATNGTSVVLGFSATLNDTIEVVAYSYAVGAYTGQAQLNGTGFVKVSGTTVSYDNSTYLTTSSAASTYQTILTNPITGTGTNNYVPKFTASGTIGNSSLKEMNSGWMQLGSSSVSTAELDLIGNSGANIFLYDGYGSVTIQTYYNDYFTILAQVGAVTRDLIAYQYSTQTLSFWNSGSGAKLSIASTGAATFSSSVTIEGNGSTIRSGNELRFNRTDNAIYTRMYDAGSLGPNGFTFDNMNGEGFHFKNNGTTIMRMPSNGYIGIGTIDPVSLLHLNSGNLTITKTAIGSTTVVGSIDFRNNHMGPYTWAQIKVQNGATHDFSDIIFSTTYGFNSLSEKMRITAIGNVGIQTTSPVVALQVGSGTVSSIPSWMRIMTVDTTQTGIGAVYNNKAIYIYNNGSALKLDAYDYSAGSALDFQIGGNGGSVVITPSGGNLLIGTTTNGGPKIAAEGQASGWGYTFYNASGGASVKTYISHGGAYGMAIDSSMNTAGVYLLKLASGDGTNRGTVEQFKVTGAGNVLIGGGSDAQVWMNRGLKIEGSRPSIDLVNNGGGTLNTMRWYGGVATKELHMNFDTSTSIWALRFNSYYLSGGAASHEFYGNGNLTIAGVLTESSSIRYKNNIQTVQNGLNSILSLRGVSYTKKETGVSELGLIAEEVESVLPDVVIKDAEGKPDSVAYARIVAVLVEAVKELKQEINVLNGKLNS